MAQIDELIKDVQKMDSRFESSWDFGEKYEKNIVNILNGLGWVDSYVLSNLQ